MESWARTQFLKRKDSTLSPNVLVFFAQRDLCYPRNPPLANAAGCSSKSLILLIVALDELLSGGHLHEAEGDGHGMGRIVFLGLPGSHDLDHFLDEESRESHVVVAGLLHRERHARIFGLEADVDENRFLALEKGLEDRRDSAGLPVLDGVEIDFGESGDVVLGEELDIHRLETGARRRSEGIPHIIVHLGFRELKADSSVGISLVLLSIAELIKEIQHLGRSGRGRRGRGGRHRSGTKPGSCGEKKKRKDDQVFHGKRKPHFSVLLLTE